MKKISIITTIAILIIALMQTSSVFAQSLGGQKLLNQINHEQNQASRAANRQTNQLQNIITRSTNTLIPNRINSLNALLKRIQNDPRLSSSEKNTLSSTIQSDINGLTALSKKIPTDTDAATAKADEKSIITSYYIYAAFMPKTRLLTIFNNLQATTANVQALVPQLQNLINTLKTQGKDTSQIQPLLDDISSQLQLINTLISADITALQNVSTTTQPAHNMFMQYRNDAYTIVHGGTGSNKVAIGGFNKIKQDFSAMRLLFKNITPTSTPAATTITTTPSVITPTTPSTSVSPTQ